MIIKFDLNYLPHQKQKSLIRIYDADLELMFVVLQVVIIGFIQPVSPGVIAIDDISFSEGKTLFFECIENLLPTEIHKFFIYFLSYLLFCLKAKKDL